MKIEVKPNNSNYDIEVVVIPYMWSELELLTRNCGHSIDMGGAIIGSDSMAVCSDCGSIGCLVTDNTNNSSSICWM